MKNHFVDVLPPNHYLFIYFTAQVVAMSVTVDNSPIQTTFTRKIILKTYLCKLTTLGFKQFTA